MIAPLVIILIALSAMLGFLSLRRLEVARGVRYFDTERAVLDQHAEVIWAKLIHGGIPLSWRVYAGVILHDVTHLGVHSAVELVRAVERPLARLSYKMRVSAPKGGGAPVSNFLRTITPDKK